MQALSVIVFCAILVSISCCPFLRQPVSSHRSLLDVEATKTFVPSVPPTKRPTTNPTVTAVISEAYCIKTSGAPIVPTKVSTCAAYSSIKAAFDAIVDSNGNGLLNRASFYGIAVRLAFHDAGEVYVSETDNLGPDGCLSSVSDNAGLIEATSLVYTTLEPIWQANCDFISRADFWALFAKLAIEQSDPTGSISINYQYGRKDVSNCQSGAGRLPDASKGLDEISRVFVSQMGLTLNDATTLIGAHTLGYVSIANSGYGYSGSTSSGRLNAWDDTPASFDNGYFQNLMDVNWRNGRSTDGSKTQWNAGNAPTIMLSCDVSLGYNPDLSSNGGLGTLNQACGPYGLSHNTVYGCSPSTTSQPSTYTLAAQYASDNALFLTNFAESFTKMTCSGYGVPKATDGATASGKLGTLTAIDLSTC